ncbi:MAG TPA: hypothetical protein VJB34_07910 [Bdellovibrionota bacterium]|nr:hypothetical protein [Bdellovibrionota bacterium]
MKKLILNMPILLKKKSLLFVVLLIAVSVSSIAVIRHNKTKKSNALFSEFWSKVIEVNNHDNALLAMNKLVYLAEEIQKYYTTHSTKDEWSLNQSAINLESILHSLKTLDINDYPQLQNLLLASELTRDFFDQEAKLAVERDVLSAFIKANYSIDPAEAVRLRRCSLQNDKNISKAIALLQENVGPFFNQQKQHLDKSERDALFSEISTKFSASLVKYLDQEKTKDTSAIMMLPSEWVPVCLFLALRS